MKAIQKGGPKKNGNGIHNDYCDYCHFTAITVPVPPFQEVLASLLRDAVGQRDGGQLAGLRVDDAILGGGAGTSSICDVAEVLR